MTLEEAFKQAIKAYWEADENSEPDTLAPKTYNKKYFEDREEEYGLKNKEEKKDKK